MRSGFFLPILVLLFACSACATLPPSGSGAVWFSWQARSALHDMCETTTCQPRHNEIGQCLRGTKQNGEVFITEVLSPTYQREASRTGVLFLCSGLKGIVGHAHFHPWPDREGCSRSSKDTFRHLVLGYDVDVVVCPGGHLRWYFNGKDGKA